MMLWVSDKNYNTVAVIDEYSSLIWTKRYIEIGDCEICVPANEKNLSLFKIGYFIERDDDDMVCRIDTIEITTDVDSGNFIIITGKDCREFLQQRIIRTYTITKTSTVQSVIQNILTNNVTEAGFIRTMPIDCDVSTSSSEMTDSKPNFETVLEKIQELGTNYNFGSKMYIDRISGATQWKFKTYIGTDRSINQTAVNPVVFSPDYENISKTTYKEDNSNFKNAVIVIGEKEDSESTPPIYELRYDGIGLDLYETCLDVSSEIPRTVTYNECIDRLNSTGASYRIKVIDETVVLVATESEIPIAILDHVEHPTTAMLTSYIYHDWYLIDKAHENYNNEEYRKITTFEGEVEPNYNYTYGIDYLLGDIVTIQNEYGISANARIIEVIESDDVSGHKIIPTFQYLDIVTPTTGLYALLTESANPLSTEDDNILKLETSPDGTRIAEESKKISELPYSDVIDNTALFPLVINGITKKIAYPAIKRTLLDIIYPVGSIYMSVQDISPQSFLGGTWERWGEGRVPVSLKSGDADFGSIEQTNDFETSKRFKLSANESGMRRHRHSFSGLSTDSASLTIKQNTAGLLAKDKALTTDKNTAGLLAKDKALTTDKNTAGLLAKDRSINHAHLGKDGKYFLVDQTGSGIGEHVVESGSTTSYKYLYIDNSNENVEDVDRTGYTDPHHTHDIDSHTHTITAHSHDIDPHTHTVEKHSHEIDKHTHDVDNHSHTIANGYVDYEDGEAATAAHNNLQPYITCYMWKRLA